MCDPTADIDARAEADVQALRRAAKEAHERLESGVFAARETTDVAKRPLVSNFDAPSEDH
ncbi:MAG: hypothetical protein M3R35_01940 [Candidatus Eremiobacteraeota bacterium]|nr:hypothetical protein [Candidatus Eremiobacteraeota bacterium]